MTATPSSVGFQPRTTPAERRADIDLRRTTADLERRLAALEDYVHTYVGSTMRYSYNVNTAVPPPTGQVRFNNATLTAATSMYISEVTDDAVTMTNFFRVIVKNGDRFMIQDRNNADRYYVYTINGIPTDSGTYWTFPITYASMSGGTAFTSPQPSIVAFRHGA